MLNFLMMFEDSSNQGSGTQGGSDLILWIILGVMIIIIIVMNVIQRKKQKKQAEEMTSNLVLGATITTIGGIVGRLVKIEEESGSYYIETGMDDNKHYLQIVKNAIYSVHTKKEGEEVIEEVTNEIK